MSNRRIIDELYEFGRVTITADEFNAMQKQILSVQAVEIERLNVSVAMLTDILTRAEVSLCAFIGDEGWSQSDLDNMDAVGAALCGGRNASVALHWLAAHDSKIRDDVADWFMREPSEEWMARDVAAVIRSLKGG